MGFIAQLFQTLAILQIGCGFHPPEGHFIYHIHPNYKQADIAGGSGHLQSLNPTKVTLAC
jgi:hypothetical protein